MVGDKNCSAKMGVVLLCNGEIGGGVLGRGMLEIKLTLV